MTSLGHHFITDCVKSNTISVWFSVLTWARNKHRWEKIFWNMTSVIPTIITISRPVWVEPICMSRSVNCGLLMSSREAHSASICDILEEDQKAALACHRKGAVSRLDLVQERQKSHKDHDWGRTTNLSSLWRKSSSSHWLQRTQNADKIICVSA